MRLLVTTKKKFNIVAKNIEFKYIYANLGAKK